MPATASLTILVGIPGCGKSTWASNFLNQKQIVSSDRIRESLGDLKDQKRSREVFEEFHRLLNVYLSMRVPAVADSTALDDFARTNLRAIGRVNNVPVHLVYFSNGVQAASRNARREGTARVPDDVMVRMAQKYETFRIQLVQEAHLYDSITEIASVN